MKVLILTTKTDHHDYFIQKISYFIKQFFVIYEKKKNKFDFKTNHILIKKRNFFEKKYFQLNKKNKINSKYVSDINNIKTIEKIKTYKPKIIIVFGTSIIKKKILRHCRKIHLINLHGGDPQKYRGLDSHLWCLYHKDFSSLVTTLHHVDIGIDTGDLIETLKIKIKKENSFNNLRIQNVENCVKLFLNFYNNLKNKKKIKREKQSKKGRYYSAFPSIFIDKAVKNLKNGKFTKR